MQHPGPIEMFPRIGFADIAYSGANSGFLYAIELDNGFVKVGRSCNPRTRLGTVKQAVKRHFGMRVGRYFVSKDIGRTRAYKDERTLLLMVRAVGAAPTSMGECFSGLDFDKAVELIKGVVA